MVREGIALGMLPLLVTHLFPAKGDKITPLLYTGVVIHILGKRGIARASVSL